MEDCPGWAFDGSSTEQAAGHSSDCLLKPVKMIADPARENASLVLCEVLSADGSVHPSNGRGTFEDDPDLWIGFEQEYTIMNGFKPLGFPSDGYPGPQGPYYCSVGFNNCVGREIVEEHLDICLEAGLAITGGPSPGISLSDDAGLPRLSIGISPEGSPNFQLLDRHTKQRLAASIGPDGAPSLHLKDAKGDIAWNAGQ